MSDFDKNNDLLKELEIQNILDERQQDVDDEQMKLTAEKYRVKPKVEEMFSNADKKPRLKNEMPDELEQKENEAPDTSNAIVGEKTAATMQTELLMDGADGDIPNELKIIGGAENESSEAPGSPEGEAQQGENGDTQTDPAKQAGDSAGAEAPAENAEENAESNKIVTLTPEYETGTQFSGEVLDELEQFRESTKIESINTIDIDINAEEREKAELERSEAQKSRYEALFGVKQTDSKEPERVVAKVPVYRPDDEQDNLLNVKAGRFSDVVAREYTEYSRSKNPSVRAHVIRFEPQQTVTEERKHKIDARSAQEKILGAVVGGSSKNEHGYADTPKEKEKTKANPAVEDYTCEDDEDSIKYELKGNIRKLFFRSVISGVIALVSIILTVITRVAPEGIISAIPVAPAAYGVFNLLLIGSSIALNYASMASGLVPLLKLKANSDTAVAVAASAALIHTVASFFCLGDMSRFNINYYSSIVLLAFFANNLGKLIMVMRVRDNFRFLTAKGQKYAAKIYNNESMAIKMLNGTPSDNNLIAYQHKTRFASNFLKISYAPDPSEELASRLAPITTVAALIVSLLYGMITVSFAGAMNSLALITALAIPVSTLLAVNVPMKNLCKTITGYGAMISGYPSVKQFCDSTAVMLDAGELFPADAIDLEGIKTFEDYNIDESLLCGIAVLKEAQNPIANAFDSVVSEAKETLPNVESVLYEDNLGLVGWINGERILVGSRALMDKYQVDVPDINYEDKYTSDGRQITFLSRAGRLVALLVTRYRSDPEMKSEMQRAEANGISFLIRTTDYNVTDDLVAKLYNLFYRSVKVLPTGLGNVVKEARETVEEQSRSYMITFGKASGLARAVSGCVRIKQNITLAIIIQFIAVVLGLVIACPLVLYAGVSALGALEVSVYVLFWAVAAIIAPAIQKP